MEIAVSKFGEFPDGTVISSYQLENDNVIIIRIINYGCIIKEKHTGVPPYFGLVPSINFGYEKILVK